MGALDFEVLDIDLDLDSGDGGPLAALALLLNVGKVPFALVMSMVVLNFWIVSMFLYYLPIEPGGVLNGLLLIPAFFGAAVITRYEVQPLKRVFRTTKKPKDIEHRVLDQRCVLLCDVSDGRLGQARIKQEGAAVVINVKAEFDSDAFKKDEVAFVFRKDEEKNIYYITKPLFANYPDNN